MPATSTKKITRLDREAASKAASAAVDEIDFAPIARGTVVVLVVIAFAFATSIFVPGASSFGGPLQDSNVGAGSTLATIERVKKVATVGVFVPWNTSGGTVVLEEILPVEADGIEVVKTGLAAPGQISIVPQRGYPPDGQILFPVEGATIEPGSGPLDGVQIAVGLRGEGSVLGFLLIYRVGGQRHAAFLPNGAVVCPRVCEDTSGVAERQRAFTAQLSTFVDAPSR